MKISINLIWPGLDVEGLIKLSSLLLFVDKFGKHIGKRRMNLMEGHPSTECNNGWELANNAIN